ncbi:hypothetical protein PC110_g19411, partial [Phytophthora cactorum]
ALFGREELSTLTAFTSGDAESASVTRQICSSSPSLSVQKKFFQDKPGSRVIDRASRGGLVSSMVRQRSEAPSTYLSTQTDSIGVLSYDTGSRVRARGW